MLVSILTWLAGFAIGYLATLTTAVIVMPSLGPAWTLIVASSILAGLAVRKRFRRPAHRAERRAQRTAAQTLWRWRRPRR